ncbi:ABC transporter permease [Glaciibacter superstes]|uniref:ABC transporter permease n=1 Tax=Glaciibacter superstes TaxID=501023 RepID=UPI00047C9727|nr:ABC transporter permease [Glaciibacter superstes]
MITFTLRRLLSTVVVVFLVSVITFYVTRVVLPDPVSTILGGQESGASAEQIAQIRQSLFLDRPFPVQYWLWITGVLTGNLGRSYLRPQDVSEMIGAALPVTFELTLLALLIAVFFGVALGMVGAARHNRPADTITSGASVLMLSVPNFFLGVLLVYLFAMIVPLFPSGGYVPFFQNPVQNLYYMVLPAVTLAMGYIGNLARFTRSILLRVYSEEYITRATASGLSRRTVLFGYGLHSAAGSILVAVGLNLASLVGGAVVTEAIFSVPGVGTLLANSILGSDLPVISALVLLVTVGVTLITWVVDVLGGIIDPRLRAVKA